MAGTQTLSTSISLTEDQIFIAVRTVLGVFGLTSALGTTIPILQGQNNRTPQPVEDDFVEIWPISRNRLGMNVDTWGPPWTEVSALQETEITIQCDVHGPASGDNAQRISTLWRDQFAVSAFENLGLAISPLYTSDPRQMPFTNGEQQWENRWVIDLCMQADIAVTTPMQFADQLHAAVTPVESLEPLP